MTSAKCAAPPSARSSRSTEVMTTWLQARAWRRRRRRAPARRGSTAPGMPGAHVAEGAGARAGVAEDHEGRVLLRPALADIRAAGLLADRDELVLAHDVAGLAPRPASPARARGSSPACAAPRCRAGAPSRDGAGAGCRSAVDHGRRPAVAQVHAADRDATSPLCRNLVPSSAAVDACDARGACAPRRAPQIRSAAQAADHAPRDQLADDAAMPLRQRRMISRSARIALHDHGADDAENDVHQQPMIGLHDLFGDPAGDARR